MARVIAGRSSARRYDEVVVFLIGMRINKLWAVHHWLPVFRSMPRMLAELSSDGSSGLLGFHGWRTGRNFMLVQYWRSADDLLAYANDPARIHRPAWMEFYRRGRRHNAVGIWHETFVVPAGASESVYGSMPRFGLARATEHVPVADVGETARERLGAHPTPDRGRS